MPPWLGAPMSVCSARRRSSKAWWGISIVWFVGLGGRASSRSSGLRTARSLGPPGSLALTVLQRIASQRSLRQTAHLLRLLARLREAGVDAMPYKGPVWAQCLYGDVSLRTWAGLGSHRPSRATAAASASTYWTADWSMPARSTRECSAKARRMGGDRVIRTEDSGVYLDVHWNVPSASAAGRSPRSGSSLDRASTCLLGREVVTPSTIDIADHQLHQRHERLGGTASRGYPGSRRSGGPLAGRTVGGCSCLRAVGAGATAGRSLEWRMPAESSGWSRHKRLPKPSLAIAIARALLRSLAPNTLDRGRPASARTRSGEADLEIRHRRLGGRRHVACRNAVLPAGTRGLGLGSFPAGLSWLYRPLRPARLAVKWARRL